MCRPPRPTERGYCWVSQFPVQPNLRAAKCQHALAIGVMSDSPMLIAFAESAASKCQDALAIENPSEPVGRDSHLDTVFVELRHTACAYYFECLPKNSLTCSPTATIICISRVCCISRIGTLYAVHPPHRRSLPNEHYCHLL